MSIHRILMALLGAAGAALFFTFVGWHWAFGGIVLGTFLAIGWPLFTLLLGRS